MYRDLEQFLVRLLKAVDIEVSNGAYMHFNGVKKQFNGEKKNFNGKKKHFSGEKKPSNGEKKHHYHVNVLKAFADPRMAFHETLRSALHEIF